MSLMSYRNCVKYQYTVRQNTWLRRPKKKYYAGSSFRQLACIDLPSRRDHLKTIVITFDIPAAVAIDVSCSFRKQQHARNLANLPSYCHDSGMPVLASRRRYPLKLQKTASMQTSRQRSQAASSVHPVTKSSSTSTSSRYEHRCESCNVFSHFRC